MRLSHDARRAAEQTITYDAMGDGVTFSTPPLEKETEITGPSALKLCISSSTADADIFAVLRVFDPQGKEVVFQGALDPHTPIGAGLAARLAPQARPEAVAAVPPVPHARREAAARRRARSVELDVEIWPTCIVVPKGYRIALTIRGKDYEWEGEATTLSNMKNPMRGCGPFVHDDPRPTGRRRSSAAR